MGVMDKRLAQGSHRWLAAWLGHQGGSPPRPPGRPTLTPARILRRAETSPPSRQDARSSVSPKPRPTSASVPGACNGPRWPGKSSPPCPGAAGCSTEPTSTTTAPPKPPPGPHPGRATIPDAPRQQIPLTSAQHTVVAAMGYLDEEGHQLIADAVQHQVKLVAHRKSR